DLGLRDRLRENLGDLASRPGYFARVAAPASTRPGDVIVLKPRPGSNVGHTVIVAQTGVRVVRADDALLEHRGNFDLVCGDVLVNVFVDSSWGGMGERRGPGERLWCFNPR